MIIVSRHCLRPWRRRPLNRNLTTSIASAQQDEEEEEHDPFTETGKVNAELSSLLRFCRHSSYGKLLHYFLVRNGLDFQAPFANLLVLMYANCSAFDDAHACLSLLPQPLQNVFTWNYLFKALSLRGFALEAFRLYRDMLEHRILPNKVTFRSMLEACTSNPHSFHVFLLHGLTLDFGLDTDAVIGTALANLYGRIGSLQDAKRVFDLILHKDVVSWTTMMLIYTQHKHSEMAIYLFEEMQLEAVSPDRVTFICAVTACDKPPSLLKGRQMHSAIVENRLEADVTVATALVSMYGKCGSSKDATTTFHQLADQNVVTWNSLIGTVFHGNTDKTFHSFHQMLIEGVLPNRETYISFFGGCAISEGLAEGIFAHARMVGSNIYIDNILSNILINMYGKCFRLKQAQKVFERMARWDVVSWTAMINVYAQHGEYVDAYLMFSNMHANGVKPNEYTFVCIISALSSPTMSAEGRCLHWYACSKGFDSNDSIQNALLNMYARFGSIVDAEWTFDRLHTQDVISWTAMISGFADHGEGNKALCLFSKMLQEGKEPNEISFVNIITACAALTGVIEGKLVHEYIVETGLDSNIEVGNALINMYGKCASMEDARGLFVSMHERDRVSWNTLLTVIAQCGPGREALGLFESMKYSNCVPDNITFMTVLSSCSHAGLVGEAWQLFMSAEQDLGILPGNDHFVCMIDILGRAGHLSDAAILTSLMPVQPTILAFMALSGSCQCHMDVDVGEYAARFLLELNPENSASYVVISNLYAAIARDMT